MAKTTAYTPKQLADSGIPPVFDRDDVVYFRYLTPSKQIIRVARADPVRGLVLALSPTNNPNKFSGEGFCRIEDRSARQLIEKSALQDAIWVSLLEGKDPKEILKGYKYPMLGDLPSGSYSYTEGERTFHIVDSDESEAEAA